MVGRRRVAGLLVAFVLLGACGADPAEPGDAGPVVDDAWVRPTPPGAITTAFYFTVTSPSADRIVGADAPGCTSTTIHQTTLTDSMMSMDEATDADLTLEPGVPLRFEPTALHVMCIEPEEPFVDGTTAIVVLRFAEADPVEVTARVENR